MSTDLSHRDGYAAAVLGWFSQNSDRGVLITDAALVVIGWNDWLVTATGLPRHEVMGRALFEVLPSLIDRGFDEYYAEALQGQVKVLSHSFHRFLVPTPPGSQHPAQMPQSGQIAPLTGTSGIIGTITVIEDVSERVASESRLRERIAAAEAASRVKDEFLATLSHEIRTPLNAVLGWTRILRSRSHIDDATLRHAVDVIDRNATAQLTLVSDMLDMARISSGKVRLEMSDVDLRAIVSGAIDAVRPAADVKDVRVIPDFPAQLPAVRGDADRLLQVAWNLVSNAVKFTDAGGRVTLRLATEGRIVVLTITDTGQGIDAVFLPHVFERFKQADPSSSRRHGGLGLGLALVKDLVHLHGGTVSVSSDGQGSGTTFRVRFPAREITTGDGKTSRADGDPHPAALHRVRVVVVEDDPDAAEIAVSTLKEAGASVFSVTSVDDALTVIRDPARAQPHVIVTDIGMPGCDGYEFVAAVRALPRESGGAIPMVALTAYATPEDRAKALRAGFDAHLPKPFDPETLVAVIARAARV